jgi:hypothetical protein
MIPNMASWILKFSLDLRREGGDFLCIARILKAVECASVGNRSHQSCNLQRGLGDSSPKVASMLTPPLL